MKNGQNNTRRMGDIDPTRNVLDLVEAANKRQDDLREAEARRVNELAACRHECADEVSALRASYDEKLILAEAKRIDANRLFDTQAIKVASERAADQASVLANQVASSAETLRALVATTAASAAQQFTQFKTEVSDRIGLIQKFQSENQGRSGITTPLLLAIAAVIGGIVSFLVQLAIQQ